MKSPYLYSSLLALSFVVSTLAMEEEKIEKKGRKTSSLAIVKELVSLTRKLEKIRLSFNKKENSNDINMNNLMAHLKKLKDLDLEKVKEDLKKVKKLPFFCKGNYIMNTEVTKKMCTLSQQLNFPKNNNSDGIGQNIHSILKKTPDHSIVITKNIENRNPEYVSYFILNGDIPQEYLYMEGLPGEDPNKINSANIVCSNQ